MLKSQELQLEALKAKARANELRGKETLTEAETAELANLEKRDLAIPGELEAAIRAEDKAAEEARAAFELGSNGDGETAELRSLLGTAHAVGKATLGRYLTHAQAGTPLVGAESELNAALEVRAQSGGIAIPWRLFDYPEVRDVEKRVDVATTTAALDGPTPQRPILARLFGRDIIAALGVRIDSVPAGMPEWPLLTGGVSPDMVAESGAAPDAAAATFTTRALKPQRLSGRYVFTVEQAAQVTGIEQALRSDMAGAVRAEMSDQVLNGTGAAPQITGLLARIAAPTAPTNAATFADYASVHALAVDGIHAMREIEVSSVVGVDSYKHAAGVFQAGSGESGTEALMRRSAGCRASSFVPDPAANVQNGNILHAGNDSMRGDSIAAVWPALEVIRDMFTRGNRGEIILTWIVLWDCYTAFRADAYKRVAFKLA